MSRVGKTQFRSVFANRNGKDVQLKRILKSIFEWIHNSQD